MNARRGGERGGEMLIVDAMNETLLVVFFFLISAGGIRDFSHEGRRGGGEAGSAGNSPFLAGVARQGKVAGKVVEPLPEGLRVDARVDLVYIHSDTHSYR